MQNSCISGECKHTILLAKKAKVSDLIIKRYHNRVPHGSGGLILNEVREAKYWIAEANSALKKVIFICKECRRLRRRFGVLTMANLSACRLKETATYTHFGVDNFESFMVKERLSTVMCSNVLIKRFIKHSICAEKHVALVLITFHFVFSKPIKH